MLIVCERRNKLNNTETAHKFNNVELMRACIIAFVFLSIFSGLAALMSADIAPDL